jgi:hypothetical protein
MRTVCAAALLAFALTGCSSDRAASETSSAERANRPSTSHLAASDVQATLPRLTRDLIPDSAFRSVRPGEMKVAECGITPTFPCTNVFFAFAEGRGLDGRIRSLRALAERNAWRVEEIERFDSGAYVNLIRREFHARYTLATGLAPPGTSMVQVQVYGPANQLDRPPAAERQRWNEAKRRYVRDANAVCSRTLRRLTNPEHVVPVLTELADRLSALEPPPGEEEQVQSFLRPLRTLVRAAEALGDDEGEDALPALVGVGEFTKRFVEAASRYGVDKCAL